MNAVTTRLSRPGLRAAAPLAIVLLAVALGFADVFGNPPASAAFGLILLTLAALLLSWLPAPLAATLFMLAAAVSSLAPAAVVFSGFQSSALWLVGGGILLGDALVRTGIDTRLAALLDALPGGSYRRALTAAMLLGVALMFIMPSAVSRVVIVMPIAAAFAGRLGFERGESGYNGVVSAAIGATYLPSFSVLPASYPNLVITGMADTLFDLKISYAGWLWLHFPVFGALKLLLVMLLIGWLFPARLPARPRQAPAAAPPWSRDQLVLAAILALAVALWVTDALHGIAAGWVGLAAGVACYLPRLGVAPPATFTQALDIGPLLLVAGLMAIGGVTAHTGLAEQLAQSITAAIPDAVQGSFPVYLALSTVNLAVQLVTTNAALPPVMLPQSAALAQSMGVDLHTVVAAHIAGYSNLPLPYLAAPTLFALHSSGIAKGGFLALITAVAAVTVLLLWPLQYLWLQAIGFL